MKTILVDDMALDMQLLELKCAGMPEIEIVGKFTVPEEAIAYAVTHEVEFAMLDIDMPGINGIELAMRLRQLRQDVIIVFITAHPRYAVQAFQMKADYMVFKPFDRADIQDVLERARLLQNRQKKRVQFHTFGNFEMLVEGKPVRFFSAKAKELMAICVFYEGRSVGIHDIIEHLCEGSENKTAENTGYRRTIKELNDTLKACNAEEIFVRERGSCRIRKELVSCDYYDFWNGKPDALTRFDGRFMSDYAWAESAIYRMCEKKGLS